MTHAGWAGWRRHGRRLLAAGALALAIARPAIALDDVPRADTLIATGQPSGGSPTFSQYKDFNPFHPGLDLRSSVVHVLEPLFFYSVLADKMIPWLAEGYEYSDGNATLTIRLRPGVTWNDGQPFTADDVVYTLSMLQQNGKGPGDQLYAAAMARDIKAVTAVDPHTVKVELTHPDPRWFFTYLTVRFTEGMFMLPKHVYAKVDPAKLANFTGLEDQGPQGPVGTGAFRIASMTPERIILDRRDDWWGAKTGFHALPAMKRVIFVPFTTHEAAAQLLANDEVDTILEAHVPVMKSLIGKYGSKITTFSGHEPPYGNIDWWQTSLFLNHDQPQFQDVRIRRAISLYINRKQAIDYAYQGAAEISALPYPRYPKLEPYFADMAETAKQLRMSDYDPKAADALMKDAGAAKGPDGIWQYKGEAMGGDLYYPDSLNALAPAIAEQLRRAGFKVAPNSRPGYRDVVFRGHAAWWLWGHGASVNDPFQTLQLYHKRAYRPVGENILWPARWRNEAFSALVDKIEALEPASPDVRPLVDQALVIWMREQVAVPISQFYHRIPFNTTYWSGWPSTENPYINPTFWHNTGALMLLGLTKTAK